MKAILSHFQRTRASLFGRNRTRQALNLLLLLTFVVLAGCSKPGYEVIDSDANGYECKKCGAKFYTDRAVFAEFCPSCKDANIRPVVGYVCDKCQHVTLTTAAHGTVACEKCQTLISASKLPSTKELTGWGAAKKTKAETCK